MGEIWQLITQSLETFKGGTMWNVIVNIHGAVKAVGMGLLVLFFVVSVVKTMGSFSDMNMPNVAVRPNMTFTYFIYFRMKLSVWSVNYKSDIRVNTRQFFKMLN